MLNIIILIFAAILLAGLLSFENMNSRKGVLPVKTLLSCLFILTAIVQPHLAAKYSLFVLIGLMFCMGGDVFLALPQKKMFLLGLVSFLIGHVFYVAAFIAVAGLNTLTFIGTLLTLGVSIGVYIWLKPHLGAMKVPVIFYIVVISVMLCGAWSILGEAALTKPGRLLVFTGALSFYLSDLLVARDRFLKQELSNRLIGLPLYYAGQFLIAFSVGALQ